MRVLLIRENFFTPNRIELCPIVSHQDSHLEAITRSFLNKIQTESLGERLYGEALATQLGIHLLRNYCTTP